MSHDALVEALAARLLAAGRTLATAESCTGGLVAAACTSIAGSSRWFERGFVSYSNPAKVESLGVDPALIERHGAVSAEVAAAMAEGALRHSTADLAVAVTGIAGPDGGSVEKPVGTVWIAVAAKADAAATNTTRIAAGGDRTAVRRAAVRRAFELLIERAGTP